MIAILDTNVFVSAILFPKSFPSDVVELVVDTATLIFSYDTAEELIRVLERPKFDRYVPRKKRVEFFDRVVGSAKVVDFVIPISACRDPNDDKFLSLAITGNADLIVTGDEDLLALHPFRGVAILTPQQFMERFWTGISADS